MHNESTTCAARLPFAVTWSLPFSRLDVPPSSSSSFPPLPPLLSLTLLSPFFAILREGEGSPTPLLPACRPSILTSYGVVDRGGRRRRRWLPRSARQRTKLQRPPTDCWKKKDKENNAQGCQRQLEQKKKSLRPVSDSGKVAARCQNASCRAFWLVWGACEWQENRPASHNQQPKLLRPRAPALFCRHTTTNPPWERLWCQPPRFLNFFFFLLWPRRLKLLYFRVQKLVTLGKIRLPLVKRSQGSKGIKGPGSSLIKVGRLLFRAEKEEEEGKREGGGGKTLQRRESQNQHESDLSASAQTVTSPWPL